MHSQYRFDNYLAQQVGKIPKSLELLMSSLSMLGEPLVVLAAGLAGYLSSVERGQDQAKSAFVYAAVAFGLCIALKLVSRRKRPDNLDIWTFGVKSYSFPSGHAFGTVIFYGLFSYLDLKFLTHPWNIVVAAVIWLLIISIGLSRVYLKAHYPTDVIGGWLLGSLSLFLIISLSF